jgi:protein TonB
MFDSITAPQRKLRRGASTAVSLILHGAAVVTALVITYARAHAPRHENAVAVTFRAPPPPPPPPPAPAGHKPKTPRPKPVTPKLPAPTAIIQPKEAPKEEAVEAPEVEEEEGEEGGVEGGVVGGVVGGSVGGTGTTLAPAAPRLEVDDAAVHLTKLSGPAIEYTEQALEREIQGLMVVKCIVTVEGVVFGCRVLKSLPFMDKAVTGALERSRYKPYLWNGRPVEIDITFKIRLTLPQ